MLEMTANHVASEGGKWKEAQNNCFKPGKRCLRVENDDVLSRLNGFFLLFDDARKLMIDDAYGYGGTSLYSQRFSV